MWHEYMCDVLMLQWKTYSLKSALDYMQEVMINNHFVQWEAHNRKQKHLGEKISLHLAVSSVKSSFCALFAFYTLSEHKL